MTLEGAGALVRAASQILGEQSSQDPPQRAPPPFSKRWAAPERLKKKMQSPCGVKEKDAAGMGGWDLRLRALGSQGGARKAPRRLHFLPRCLYSCPGTEKEAKWPQPVPA